MTRERNLEGKWYQINEKKGAEQRVSPWKLPVCYRSSATATATGWWLPEQW